MSNTLLARANTAQLAIKSIAIECTAPVWLGGDGVLGGNLQTIWAARCARRFTGSAPAYTRERWATPDHDFIDVDFLQQPEVPARDAAVPGAVVPDDATHQAVKPAAAATRYATPTAAAPNAPPSNQALLVMFHGLEGSSGSHYAQAFAHFAREHQLAFAVPHFRGCSGELNRAPRAYHSGDWQEIDWILRRLQARHAQHSSGPVLAVGVSLGGNALMRWAGELQHSAASVVRAVASVCSPLDMVSSGQAIGRGFNRQVYTRMFLRSMKPNALRKLAQYPGLVDRQRVLASRDLYEFDDVFTAPLHGFKNTDDYWARASAKPHLAQVRVPALCLNALNDPFVPAHGLPRSGEVGPYVQLWQPAHGGHVGFPTGRFPGHVLAMPQAVGRWLLAHR